MSCKEEPTLERLDGTKIELSKLEERVGQLMENAAVTGLEIAVFNSNTLVYQKAFGYANIETKEALDANHIMYGASFSKAVFGYLVAQLVLDGVIDLDRPLYEYLEVELPDLDVGKKFRSLSDLREDERYKKITGRMCMSHSTGLPNWRWINNPDEKLRILFEPGTRYSYSGEGMMLLQWIIEHQTEKTLEELAREMVFKPLGMTSTDYLWRGAFEAHFCYGHSTTQEKLRKKMEKDDAAAAGSMETTLADYSKFISHILQLNQEGAELSKILFQPNIRIKSKAQFGPLANEVTDENDAIKLSYGLGWGLLESPFGFGAFKEGHGEGFQHYSILFPESGIGIILMSNSDNAEGIFKELLELTIEDTFTPWKWENYIPYQMK